MNIADGGRDAPLSRRARFWFIGACAVLCALAIVLVIIAR